MSSASLCFSGSKVLAKRVCRSSSTPRSGVLSWTFQVFCYTKSSSIQQFLHFCPNCVKNQRIRILTLVSVAFSIIVANIFILRTQMKCSKSIELRSFKFSEISLPSLQNPRTKIQNGAEINWISRRIRAGALTWNPCPEDSSRQRPNPIRALGPLLDSRLQTKGPAMPNSTLW